MAMITSNNFKILSIRILEDCKTYIKKCLKEKTFYYLCHDYEISEDGQDIEPASKNLHSLNDDFFNVGVQRDSISINISAVVGKNGDGKSSLVEVFLRMINNLSKQYEFNPNHELQYVEGVCAECYYIYNGDFYRIKEENANFQVFKYKNNGDHHTIIESPLSKEEVKGAFFYTLVSNYSLYAYNVEDYHEEFSNADFSNPENCWLHHIFHKNDSYQVPISLHPYRFNGDIDVNNENSLSRQRLLSIYLQSDMANELVNGKKASAICLNTVGYSKLQKVTFEQYFRDNLGTNLLQAQIDELSLFQNEGHPTVDESSRTSGYYLALNYLYDNYIKKHEQYYQTALNWARNNNLLPATSDISALISKLIELPHSEDVFLYQEWELFKDFGLSQILHLEYVDHIYDLLKREDRGLSMKPQDFFLPVSNNSDEKLLCKHYLLYKTIRIFDNYYKYNHPEKQFISFIKEDFSEKALKTKSKSHEETNRAFEKLQDDWRNKSHTTLKLRQTYNHLKRIEAGKRIWSPSQKMKIIDLQENHASELRDLENMPPAIYSWDILFEASGQKEPIRFSTFSSGEKQKLYNIGAIVYHLSNIDSNIKSNSRTGSDADLICYKSVNIILEEIELYFHPEWQRTLIFDLMNMIRRTRLGSIKSINMIFVTHSPYILSDIPKTNVLFLKDGVPCYNMQENTFGANINSLLKNGFFLPGLPIGQFAHEKIDRIFAKLHSGDFNDEELKKLKQEILLIGEPFIRQQLMTLYNTYTEFNKEAIETMIANYLYNKH